MPNRLGGSREKAFDDPWPDSGITSDRVRPDHIRRIVSDAPEEEGSNAPAQAFHLVMTHNHDLDLRICHAILSRDRFGFLGLIGSKTKNVRFMRRLKALGLSDASIARMICPIGAPGISGKEPEIIAIAVAAQLLALSC